MIISALNLPSINPKRNQKPLKRNTNSLLKDSEIYLSSDIYIIYVYTYTYTCMYVCIYIYTYPLKEP